MYQKVIKRFSGIFTSLLFLGVMVGTAGAVTTFNMTAGTTTKTMPDSTVVPMWGFALVSTDIDGTVTAGDGIVKVPGDVLVVPPGETTVTINLTNNLTEPVSLHILGQLLDPTVTGGVPQGPVWTTGLTDTVASTGSRTAGNTTARVRSFTHETPPLGGTAVYTWNDFRPGTFMLQSATNPAKQVQMGLYAAVTQDVAAGEAYTGAFYTKELVLVYSEVDPEMHLAIDGGYYGSNPINPPPPDKVTIPSSLHRDSKYFLINGMAYAPGGGLDPVNATPIGTNDRVLLRLLNAGYEIHVPQILNMNMRLMAEDGNPLTYSREQYGISLPAAKTADAIIKPTIAGTFPLYDAMLQLTNAGDAAPGGMLSYLDIVLVDTDGDSVVDNLDNCILQANANQRDTNGDGFGNICDTDLNNDGITNGLDVGALKLVFLNIGPGLDADFNGDQAVNGLDVGILKSFFLQPPGPSGLVP